MEIAKAKWLTSQKIAHRGLHDGNDAPENSLAAFGRAITAGYAIELDLQLTADGEVLVFHDDDMERLLGIKGDVRAANAAAVRAARILGSAEKVPTFAEMLAFIGGKTPLLIELKDTPKYTELCQKTTELLRGYSGEFAVQSFNPFIVKWFKVNAPEFVRGQLASDFKGTTLAWWKKFMLKNLFFIRGNGSMFVSYDISAIRRRRILRVKRRMPVLAWTVRSAAEAQELARYFNNIIFENFLA